MLHACFCVSVVAEHCFGHYTPNQCTYICKYIDLWIDTLYYCGGHVFKFVFYKIYMKFEEGQQLQVNKELSDTTESESKKIMK